MTYVLELPDAEPMDNIGPTTADDGYGDEYGGYPGFAFDFHSDPWSHSGHWAEADHRDAQGRDVDYSMMGQPGHTDSTPWTMGVVSPAMVENHALTGRVQKLRRTPESELVSGGPVQGQDYRSALAMQLVQQEANQAYDEASQVAVISGI